MPVIATNSPPAGQRVSIMLANARCTSEFRAAVFAAAARAGQTPADFLMLAAAETMKARGSAFSGVIEPGDLVNEAGPDPFAGSDHRVALEIGGGFVTEAEKATFDAAKPKGTYYVWAVELMRAAVRARASR